MDNKIKMTAAVPEAFDDGMRVMNPDFIVTSPGENGWSARWGRPMILSIRSSRSFKARRKSVIDSWLFTPYLFFCY
jgi:hypothetical protein